MRHFRNAILDLNKNRHNAISASVEQLHSTPLPSEIALNSVGTTCWGNNEFLWAISTNKQQMDTSGLTFHSLEAIFHSLDTHWRPWFLIQGRALHTSAWLADAQRAATLIEHKLTLIMNEKGGQGVRPAAYGISWGKTVMDLMHKQRQAQQTLISQVPKKTWVQAKWTGPKLNWML